MKTLNRLHAGLISLIILLASATAYAAENSGTTVRHTGVSSLWILANISYAGMRAQSNPNGGWRVLSFIFGFPGTLVSFLVVDEGGCRAYGIELPPRKL